VYNLLQSRFGDYPGAPHFQIRPGHGGCNEAGHKLEVIRHLR
jgi:hypothetical protein